VDGKVVSADEGDAVSPPRWVFSFLAMRILKWLPEIRGVAEIAILKAGEEESSAQESPRESTNRF
jgi:hypothetical protein